MLCGIYELVTKAAITNGIRRVSRGTDGPSRRSLPPLGRTGDSLGRHAKEGASISVAVAAPVS